MSPFIDWYNPWSLYPPRSPLLDILPIELIDQHHILPLALEDGVLHLASYRPLSALLRSEVRMISGLRESIEFVEAPTWERLYTAFRQSTHLGEAKPIDDRAAENSTLHTNFSLSSDAKEDSSEAPRLADAILHGAWQRHASDIHLEPERDGLLVRLRIDGILHEYMRVPEELASALIARLKLMTELDLMEKRIAQDGHLFTRIHDLELNLRVSTLPVFHGEKLVLRFLHREQIELSLPELGMSAETVQNLEAFLTKPYGLLLVAGPTGSGKTTTLYTALHYLRDSSRNITTIEDPIEYELAGVNQIAVNVRSGMTFAAGLRGILRQDPDIVMIGEIRDRETADIALRAAITGRLVLSSIHTGDACGAILRLLDMGLEPYLVASALIGVVSQRLVRRICNCAEVVAERDVPWATPLEQGKTWSLRRAKPEGCLSCHGSGYSGRAGIFETLHIDDSMGRLILERAEQSRLHQEAQAHGWVPMRFDGWRQCREGRTDLAELRRVLS